MNIRKFVLSVISIAVFSSALFAFAAEGRLEAALERDHVSPGNPIYLNISFYGGTDVPLPGMPEIEGLRVKYVGPATQVSVVNGAVSRSITHSYLVFPLKEGNYEIGPFSVDVGGKTYSAKPVTLVVSSQPSVQSPGASSRAASGPGQGYTPVQSPDYVPETPRDIGDKVFLIMEAPRTQVYINEIVPLTIRLYVDNMGLKDIEYPMLDSAGFSSGEWEEPIKRQEQYKGTMYNVLVFRRNIFGIKEGDYTLGPASLSCKAMVPQRRVERRPSFFRSSIFDDQDFFSDVLRKYEVYPLSLESKPVRISVLPFPESGKPAGFKGAVGDFNMEVAVDAKEVKVGDPVTVRMIISGTGNMDTVTAPVMDAGDRFKTYEPQVTKKDNKKIYEQILIPKTVKSGDVPEISFSFFDPGTGSYKTVKNPPVPLKIAEQPESEKGVKVVSTLGREDTLFPPEVLGEDIRHIKESIGKLGVKGRFLYKNAYFLGGEAVPLILLVTLIMVHRRKERIRTDTRYARVLKAPGQAKKGIRKAEACLKKKDTANFYDILFKTLKTYLGNRLNLPGGVVTALSAENKLKPALCDENVLGMIRDVFTRCEMARYASSVTGSAEAEETLETARKIMDYLEKIKL